MGFEELSFFNIFHVTVLSFTLTQIALFLKYPYGLLKSRSDYGSSHGNNMNDWALAKVGKMSPTQQLFTQLIYTKERQVPIQLDVSGVAGSAMEWHFVLHAA